MVTSRSRGSLYLIEVKHSLKPTTFLEETYKLALSGRNCAREILMT